jgi:Zn-dependent peptidase ImmA (M78 family)
VNPEAEGRDAAERFRRNHNLGVQPLGDLAAIIEQEVGVDVTVLDADRDEHGLTIRDPDRDMVLIGVARTRHPMRQRSTLAHELGHVLFQDWDDKADSLGNRTPGERRADAFARHLLVPLEGLRTFLGHRERITETNLSAVVQRFLASPAIVAIAMEQAGYIDEIAKQTWKALSTPTLAVRFGWSDQYRALQAESERRRAPQRLLNRAVNGYAAGRLHAQAIATLRGITLEVAEADLREAGVVPAAQPAAWASPSDLPEVQVDEAALAAALDTPEVDGQDVVTE